uniref:RRM_6 domain containing protein n=1 Tax=Echinococcus granulosus TaxID=6210 RepID=U6FQJ1_ECHGR|nr:RRM_6 domain containing protein [Echinococcus granulosus]
MLCQKGVDCNLSHWKSKPSSGNKTAHRLVVHDLTPAIGKKTIRKLVSQFSALTKVKIDKAEHKAFVEFSTLEAIQMAMAAAPLRIKDVDLRVSLPDDQN